MAHAGHPRAAKAAVVVTGSVDLVSALIAIAGTFTPEGRARKRALLMALETAVVARPRTLLRLHEVLCFLQAYPDDQDLLERVDRLLRAKP